VATYQVFVERPSSKAPDALDRLAAAMAQRYGLPLDQLEPRLRAGRFRVKNNVDLDTAEKFAADLEKLGAIVSVVDANGVALARSKPTPTPTPAPAPAPRAPQTQTNPPTFSSGLSAAFSGTRANDPDLGALGDVSGNFAVASLDGSDERAAAPSGSFAPPSSSNDALPASMGPPIAQPKPSKHDAPIDMFAPPDAEAEVALAVDLPAKKRPSAASMAPPTHSAHPERSLPSAAKGGESKDAPTGPSALAQFAGNTRARFAAGALLTVIVGFVPAYVLSTVRERSAYAEVDRHLAEKAAQLRTMEQWNGFDKIRDASADEKIAEKHAIALTSALLWAVVSAGFAFVWFRKIDWDRFASR
jgi:hypothetical protein